MYLKSIRVNVERERESKLCDILMYDLHPCRYFEYKKQVRIYSIFLHHFSTSISTSVKRLWVTHDLLDHSPRQMLCTCCLIPFIFTHTRVLFTYCKTDSWQEEQIFEKDKKTFAKGNLRKTSARLWQSRWIEQS